MVRPGSTAEVAALCSLLMAEEITAIQGWTWEPALETKIVRQVLNLGDGDNIVTLRINLDY